jgi:hypothetical protein
VNRRGAGATALAAVLTLGACGTTYIDTDVTIPDTATDATTTTLAPVDPDTPLDVLLPEIELLMSDLDERIIDQDRQYETLDRIEAIWSVAERRIRADDPDDVFNFQQAIDLARTGVERRRPADASKGSKIIAQVIDAYLGRA